MKPIVKWVGGKTQMLQPLLDAVGPEPLGRYFEPFCGGAALFWALHQRGRLTEGAHLNDMNMDLMDMYRGVRDDPEGVDQELRELATRYYTRSEDTYYEVRSAWNLGKTSPARFIFLKQAAFNGLWRVNKSGLMNSPWGHYTRLSVPDLDALKAYAAVLSEVVLSASNWWSAVYNVHPGDLVYLDPPYLGTFNQYDCIGFDEEDQVSLLRRAQELTVIGAHVIYNQRDSEYARKLIAEHWPASSWQSLETRRSINRDGDNRMGLDLLVVSDPNKVGTR